MLAELRDLFFKYAPWIILIPTGIIFRKSSTALKERKPIRYYLTVSVITQFVSGMLWVFRINNLPMLHIYTLLEFLTVFWYYCIILEGAIPASWQTGISLGFTLVALLDSVFLETIFTFNTLSRSVEALIFLFLSVLWLLRATDKEEKLPLRLTHGRLYIVSGFLIYFSGSIVLFSFSNRINFMAFSLSFNIWSMHTLLLVVLYLAITLGLLNYRKR